MRPMSRIVVLSSCLVLAPQGLAQSDAMTIEGEGTPATTTATLEGKSIHNQVRVDGAKSTAIDNRSAGMTVATTVDPVRLQLGVAAVTRDLDEQRAGSRSTKKTQIASPLVAVNVTPTTSALVGMSVIRTNVSNDAVPDGDYTLNNQRAVAGFRRQTADSTSSLIATSEARAEHDYDVYGYPMVDRDYAPLQVDFDQEHKLNDTFKADWGVRYSHYNDDVYKDQYDSDVPKTPTVAQVFDYLLSLKAGVTYAVTRAFDLRTEVKRKAALDTNSYESTEYLVGNAGAVTATLKVGDAATVGLGFETSAGKKTHEVQGQSYAYADQRREVRVSVGAAL